MKAFAPAILLGLVGASSACTFAYECGWSEPDSFWQRLGFSQPGLGCEFAIYHEDDVTPPDDGTRLGYARFDPSENNEPGEMCWPVTGENLGGVYNFCMDGLVGPDGKVEGPITVERGDGGNEVDLRGEGSEEHVDDSDPVSPVAYWKSGVECPGASLPTSK